MIVYKKNIKTFSCHISFLNDGRFDKENVHLFEHLFVENILTSLHDDPEYVEMLQYINAVTLGIGFSLYIECHNELSVKAVKLLQKSLELSFSITQEQLEKEQSIIGIENVSLPSFFQLCEGINKYYDVSHVRPTVDHILEIYTLTMKQQRPVIIVQADMDNPVVQNAVSLLESMDETWEIEAPQKNIVKSPYASTYKPYITNFYGGTSNSLRVYLSLRESRTKDMLAYTVFLTRLIGDLLFEYVRFVEETDYQPEFAPRITPYGYECSWGFLSSASSTVITDLLYNLFHIDKDNFLRLQRKIVYDHMLRWDNLYDTFYWSLQYFAKTGSFVSIEESAEYIRNIQFEDFLDYYETLLDRFSLEIAR